MDLEASARQEYGRAGLDEADLAPDPIEMFERWMRDASEAGLHEPNAMVVSTVDADGHRPSRMVLLKGLGPRPGFVFFTNTDSRKGTELAGNPRCALLFPWHPLERQVRVDGVASRSRRPTSRRTSRPGRAAPSSAPGRRPSPAWSTREELAGVLRGCRGALPRARSRSPRSGAGTSSPATPSSSGRAARAGCTTGSATAGAPRAGYRWLAPYIRPRAWSVVFLVGLRRCLVRPRRCTAGSSLPCRVVASLPRLGFSSLADPATPRGAPLARPPSVMPSSNDL